MRITPIAQSEFLRKCTGICFQFLAKNVPSEFLSKYHPSFKSLPMEISGEVTAAMMNLSLKMTEPKRTSAILASLIQIGLPCASTNEEPSNEGSGWPMWPYSNGSTEPSAPESSTTSTSLGSERPIALIENGSSSLSQTPEKGCKPMSSEKFAKQCHLKNHKWSSYCHYLNTTCQNTRSTPCIHHRMLSPECQVHHASVKPCCKSHLNHASSGHKLLHRPDLRSKVHACAQGL